MVKEILSALELVDINYQAKGPLKSSYTHKFLGFSGHMRGENMKKKKKKASTDYSDSIEI